tara:strand:+ start:3267 stop:4376 length:1110 start_codon:yes stop_codon:yes gene_type:complete
MVKINSNMLERAGYNLGVSKTPKVGRGFDKGYASTRGDDIDFSKMGEKIQAKKKKSDELLNKFPKGINIPKVPEGFRPQLTQWLTEKKQEFSNAATVIAKGREADPEAYDKAVEAQNNIEASYLEMSTTLETAAKTRQNAADRYRDKSNAASMTDNEKINFHNLYQANYGADGLNAQIVDNKLMFTNAAGKQIDAKDFGGLVGTAYDYAIENTIDNLTTGIENLVTQKNPYWNKESTKRELEKIARDSQAVKNYIYQNPELIDNYISNQSGVPITVDDSGNPIGQWKDFKEGKLYPTGSGNYDDFYNINKVNDDFSNGFVETAMSALENSYTNAKTNYEQYLQEQKVAEATPEETEKTTGGEFDNLIGG